MGLVILLVLLCAAHLRPPWSPRRAGSRRSSTPRRSRTSTSWPSSRSSRCCRRGPRRCSWCSGPPLAIVLLLAVPFLAGTGEKSWKRRPVAVLGVILIVLTVTTLAGLGVVVPWSPVMDAWSASADAGGVREGADAARAPGGPGDPEQAMPQLPQPRRRRRPAGSRPRRRRHPPDAGSADPSGPAGGREHAGVRQEPDARPR